MPVTLLLMFVGLLAGCASIGPREASAPRPLATVPPVRAPLADASEPEVWRVALHPQPRTGRIRVSIDAPVTTTWSAPSPRHGVTQLEVRDGGISYVVAPSEASPCAFEVTPNHALFCGAAVLGRPEVDERRRIELRLAGDAAYYPQAASSYGMDSEAVIETTFAELHRAGFLFGRLQHARFDAEVGRDHAAWLGYFAFDPRWVAAEAAGVRTAVDSWLGIRRPPRDPSVGLLFVPVARTSQEVTIRPLYRGVLVQAGPAAAWGVRARLDLTRRLVQRTLGAAITVEHPTAAWWFDEGIAHGVALRVLQAMGALTEREVAGEVSAWLAEEALAEDERAPRLLALRGALLAVTLDGSEGALQPALRALVRRRAEGGDRAIDLHSFFAAVEEHEQRKRTARIGHAFEHDEPLPLRAADIGPCVRLLPRRVHRFELGFEPTPDGRAVLRVERGSAAARAGLRSGDVISSLDYVDGDGDSPVRLELDRDGRAHPLRYLPQGRSRPALAAIVAPECEAPAW